MATTIPDSLVEVLLGTIPSSERLSAMRKIAFSLRPGDEVNANLVVKLNSQIEDADTERALYWHLNQALVNGQMDYVARICIQSHRTTVWLSDQAVQSLIQLMRLGDDTDSPQNGYGIRPRLPLISRQLIMDDDTPATDSIAQAARVTCSHFKCLRDLIRLASTAKPVVLPVQLLSVFRSSVSLVDKRLHTAARDVIFAFLLSLKSRTVALEPRGIPDLSFWWSDITTILEEMEDSLHRSTAYQLWLRLLAFDLDKTDLCRIVNTDQYWALLQKGLATGDGEQRKTSLQILRASLVIFDARKISIHCAHFSMFHLNSMKDNRSILEDYERFCTVYETIVIGRYVNQALQCIGDLNILASPSTAVHKSWLYALLLPALEPSMTDSIQKIIGDWLMTVSITRDQHFQTFAQLLDSSFLPWAIDGKHFTGSLSKKGRHVSCEHGSRLANFIERIFTENRDYNSEEACRLWANTILSLLLRSKNRIMSTAVVYVLHGLRKGLRRQRALKQAELQQVLDLSTVVGFPEVAQDLVMLQCYDIWCGYSLREADMLQQLPGYRAKALRLEARDQQLSKKHSNGTETALSSAGAPALSSLEELEARIATTRSACLRGAGLVDVCQSLQRLLSEQEAPLSAQTLSSILAAIWMEIEVQDLPKSALMLFPAVCFHQTVLAYSSNSEELADFLTHVIVEYRGFVKGKIYLWTPFMLAIRPMVLMHPNIVQRFGIRDFIVDLADHPPTAKVEFQLEAAAFDLLTSRDWIYQHLDFAHYYGEIESLGWATFYDMVSRLSTTNPTLADELLKKLLSPWLYQPVSAVVVNKWKTTEQLQVILIFHEGYIQRASGSDIERYYSDLLRIISVEPLPRFRFLLEWMAARSIIRHHKIADELIVALSNKDHHSNPKYLSSLLKIAVMITCTELPDEIFALRVASITAALSASSKIVLRHEAQWSFPLLWDAAVSKGWTKITESPPLKQLVEYIWSLDKYNEPLPVRTLERLDPIKEHNLVNLLTGGYLELEPQGSCRLNFWDFYNLQQLDDDNLIGLPPRCMPLGEPPADQRHLLEKPGQQKTAAQPPRDGTSLVALQTKGSAYLNSTLVDSTTLRATDLIVIASLLDNPYNLGGLSRVSEVFGAHSLYISNPLSLLANKDFTSVSVSSHNHIPIHRLAVVDIPSFLKERKNEGYSVVGVEQTDRSVILGHKDTMLPKKTVLIMGAEKEGIPAMLLGECDVLVEVPQKGVTRSLNVQTAAAAVLFEYSRQHAE